MPKLNRQDNRKKLKRHRKQEDMLPEEHTEEFIEVKEKKRRKRKSKRDIWMNISE